MKKSELRHIINEEIRRMLHEDTGSRLIDDILEEIDPVIYELIDKSKTSTLKKDPNYKWTDYDSEYVRFKITEGLLRSIEGYTNPTDKLISIEATPNKGVIIISCVIEREGKQHFLNTEVIYAGGYNIQQLHYRYITKTNLPKTGNNTVTKQYTEKIKRLSSIEKIKNEIKTNTIRIEKTQSIIDWAKTLSNDDIIEYESNKPGAYNWPSWEEIIRRGADKNFNYSEKEFNSKREEDKKRKIEFFKSMKISSNQTMIDSLIKTNEKLTKKLNSL